MLLAGLLALGGQATRGSSGGAGVGRYADGGTDGEFAASAGAPSSVRRSGRAADCWPEAAGRPVPERIAEIVWRPGVAPLCQGA